MKLKYVSFFAIMSVIILSFIVSISSIHSIAHDPLSNREIETNLIPAGHDTVDWTMKEIFSDSMKTFSSFAGKVIVMDFFAGWCGPCIASMPHLRAINDYYSSESNFQMMSIDVDPGYFSDEASLETWATNLDMNWFVFRDLSGIVDSFYGISAIPTLMIINQYQYVYYVEEGFASEEVIIGIIDELLAMEDTSAPVINDLQADKESISVKDNSVQVSADVNDVALRYAKYTLTLGDYVLEEEFWKPPSGIITYNFVLDPLTIWDATQNGTTTATIDLYTEDFTGTSTTDQMELSVDNLLDTGIPVIEIDKILETSGSYGQNYDIYAKITDDLKVLNATAEIWVGSNKVASQDMIKNSTDIFRARFFSVKINLTEGVYFNIIAQDVSGKKSNLSINYTDVKFGGISLPVIISSFIFTGLLIIPIQKLKKK